MKKLLFLSFIIILIGCNNQEAKSILIQNTGEAFGTTYNIQYESETDYHDDLKKVFDAVNQSMSTYIATSDISRINQGDTTLVVDDYFTEVFNTSKELWLATKGFFDPTVGPLVNAYGFGPDGTLKGIDSTQIDSIMQFVGFEKLKLTNDKQIVKQDPRTFIDFNAIAKGYAIDLLGSVLNQNKVENYLIELGGELLGKGKNNQTQNNWIVGVDDPTQQQERTLLKKLKLIDRAMATSGNYRKTRIDPITKANYVHTINPKTGWPQKSNVFSVSVLAENCMLADGFATAFMVMELEETQAFLEKHSDLDVYIIYTGENGEMQEWLTAGFQEVVVD
ncbi:MAG: FAD:protein FMN transferase [Flavobacteriaceae bacterium]|nr:FAD:protein FMN transferase [Flavobacteriaceae bacterium]